MSSEIAQPQRRHCAQCKSIVARQNYLRQTIYYCDLYSSPVYQPDPESDEEFHAGKIVDGFDLAGRCEFYEENPNE